jgi:hypothetical protein
MHGYNQKHQKDENFCLNCCAIFLAILFVLASLTLPVVVLAYTENFRLEITCEIIDLTHNLSNISPPPMLQSQVENATENLIPVIPRKKSGINLAETIGIYNWMIIHGSIGIFEVFVIIIIGSVSIFYTKKDKYYFCSYNISIAFLLLLVFFRFVWLIVGGVMFWRDCYNLSPPVMNDLVWAALIIGFMGFACSLTSFLKTLGD